MGQFARLGIFPTAGFDQDLPRQVPQGLIRGRCESKCFPCKLARRAEVDAARLRFPNFVRRVTPTCALQPLARRGFWRDARARAHSYQQFPVCVVLGDRLPPRRSDRRQAAAA